VVGQVGKGARRTGCGALAGGGAARELDVLHPLSPKNASAGDAVDDEDDELAAWQRPSANLRSRSALPLAWGVATNLDLAVEALRSRSAQPQLARRVSLPS
jgi:hypothetical protein